MSESMKPCVKMVFFGRHQFANSITGQIGSGHPYMPEGSVVQTSEILSTVYENDHATVVETRNTVYILNPPVARAEYLG